MSSFDSKAFLLHLSTKPGVYRMYDIEGGIIYVGKAKNLKNRLSSYFRNRGLDNKTVALVSRIHTIEVTVVHSETEALLLEHSLIKKHRPKYNIMLIDGKSYPYIFFSDKHKSPGVYLHRGSRRKNGSYYGPYPNSYAVKEAIILIEKHFQLRNCEDSVFENRSRPCLQYQIKRCTAPCVDLVSKENYSQQINDAKMFLEGKNDSLITSIEQRMDSAVLTLEFEQAALHRDQLQFLRKVQEQQSVAGKDGDCDVFSIIKKDVGVALHLLMVRKGKVIGSKSFFPKVTQDIEAKEILTTMLAQYYLTGSVSERMSDLPHEILVNELPGDHGILETAIAEQTLKNIKIRLPLRGMKKQWLELANTNSVEQLAMHISKKDNIRQRYTLLAKALGFDKKIKHMECFDISHTFGEATVASCVVFNDHGPDKKRYRRMNIEGIEPGDDYAAMSQALKRRYTRLKKEEQSLPDLLIVDGGKGQLNAAKIILEELNITMPLLGVAKGVTRKPGLETLFLNDIENILEIDKTSPALHLIQHIRDESHRFAITGHRAKRDKSRIKSKLDEISGIGPTRKKALLRQFGSVKEMQGLAWQEINKVKGISVELAKDIMAHLQSG
jgi:excinuclease ABC subunit C